MCHDVNIDSPVRNVLRRQDLVSGRRSNIRLRRVRAGIVEMEDVLFHHNSCVLMPTGPAGLSSEDGAADDSADEAAARERQRVVTGFEVLALVLREFEVNPHQKMVFAGHTDTSGRADYNFELSLMRAQNAQYLLTTQSGDWADLCYRKHKIEDYQQIMKYFVTRHRDWNCDPGPLDNIWGDNTRRATENFFAANNLPPAVYQQVIRDGNKRWPVAAWEKVFELYQAEICRVLGISHAGLETMIDNLVYIDDEKKCLGCGESFPIDQAEQDNYRSQTNRRVEIFLFAEDEEPELDCPDRVSTVHTTEECPLRNRHHFQPAYIDPADLTAIAYHLEFIYYDRTKQSYEDVPAGLAIGAFEVVGDRTREIRATTSYSDGTYIVRVQDNPDRDELFFEFATDGRRWIYTDSDGATPEIREAAPDTVAGLPWADRVKYYDLPRRWSSRNYWVHNQSNTTAGRRYEDAMDNRDIKPYGNNTTTMDEPLVFSLDDIVLIDGNGRQSIRDKSDAGGNLDLHADSRITLLYLDPDDEFKMEIFDPRDTHPYFSNIVFDNNLIIEFMELKIARLVVFAGEFYSIWDKRTEHVPGFSYDNGHVIGARAAVLNDQSNHAFEHVHVNFANGNPPYDYVQDNCGNYELHYLDRCGFLNNKPLSYLIVYWHCRFRAHPTKPPTDANWRDNFERHSITGSMERSNRPYLLEKTTGSKDIFIRPFYFLEAKLDGRGGEHRALVDITQESGAWMLPTTAKFEQQAYQPIHGYYSTIEPIDGDSKQDVDGSTYDPFTANHEFGHATGCFDDYMYSLKDGSDTYFGLPGFDQPYTAPGGPYSKDLLARMYHNRSPRMRNFWHFVNWVNDKSGGDLNAFLNGTKFMLTYSYSTSAGDARKIELDLRDAHYRDTCRPSFRENNYVIKTGRNGKADLLLYKTGGETTYTLDAAHEFKAILVVRTKFSMDFHTGFWNWLRNRRWNKQRRQNWMVQHLLLPIDGLNRFYLHCADANNAFHKTMLTFQPFFCLGSAPAGEPEHFSIEVTYNNSTDFETDDSEIEVGSNVNHDRILKYIYGKTGAGDFVPNDFARIAEWIGGADVANGNFSVRRR